MESKSKGELTEMRFMVEATKQGFIVSKPFGDNQRYDFVIDGGEGCVIEVGDDDNVPTQCPYDGEVVPWRKDSPND